MTGMTPRCRAYMSATVPARAPDRKRQLTSCGSTLAYASSKIYLLLRAHVAPRARNSRRAERLQHTRRPGTPGVLPQRMLPRPRVRAMLGQIVFTIQIYNVTMPLCMRCPAIQQRCQPR
jgi:hypothetical protein